MSSRPGFESTILRACVIGIAFLAANALGQNFRTTSFNAKLKINSNRTLTVDETIQIVPSGSAPLTGIVLAEAPSGSHKIQFLVSRSTAGTGTTPTDLTVQTQDDKVVADLPPTSGSSPVQIHVNYSVLGTFTDHSGGTLGSRSTMSWNIVPSSWPSSIESSLLEVEYPDKSTPLYVGATTDDGSSRSSIEKTQNTAFSGKLDAFDVSEGSDGITMKPPSGIPAKAGMHLLIAISKKDLKAAPARLSAEPTTRKNTPPTNPSQQRDSHKPAPVSQDKQSTKDSSTLLLLLPLFPPLMFFFIYLKRFAFLRGKSFPTSAVPEGLGPAEAGYILDGALRARHVLGALSVLADGGLSKHGSATVDQNTLGPLEKRALEIISRRSTTADPKQLRTFLNGSLQDLQTVVIQNLGAKNLLYPSAKRGRIIPGLSLLLTLAIAGYFSTGQDLAKGLIFTVLGIAAGSILIYSLSPLTQNGARVFQRIAGLDKFLCAHVEDFNAPEGAGYLEHLRPFAIAFGVAKEE